MTDVDDPESAMGGARRDRQLVNGTTKPCVLVLAPWRPKYLIYTQS